MEIHVTAPNRIDVAGGTTDIYPLFLLMDGGFTVNVAVNVLSRVTLRTSGARSIKVFSKDLNERAEAGSPAELPLDGPLGLICRAVRAVPPGSPVEIITENEAPKGSGLGASSALLIALLTGLLTLGGKKIPPKELINLAANIETSVIRVPAGLQDYIAALLGGVSRIDFGYEGFRRETVSGSEAIARQIERWTVLSYTGEGRFSGMNNWEVTKDFIDGQGDVREKLTAIRDVARRAGELISSGDMEQLAAAVLEEWDFRRALAPGVSTPRIESMAAAATNAGALATKVCGAGGGGCMLTMAPPERRPAVEQAIERAGGKVLDFSISLAGVQVTSVGH